MSRPQRPTYFRPSVKSAKASLPQQPIDGLSLVPLLRETVANLDRKAIYFHYPHYHHSRPAGAMRMGDWKLIEFFDGSPLELYNLREDLGETTNRAQQQTDLARKMQADLAKWREAVGARMPTPNPKYDPARANEWWNRQTNTPLDVKAMAERYKSQQLQRKKP